MKILEINNYSKFIISPFNRGLQRRRSSQAAGLGSKRPGEIFREVKGKALPEPPRRRSEPLADFQHRFRR